MKELFVIDASGWIYRAYFAIRNMTNDRGESTNALFGFVRTLMKLMNDFHPTHLIAAFDGKEGTKKRKEIYPKYKAHRAEMPGDLRLQIDWAEQFCFLSGIPSLRLPFVEADDTMGSIATWASALGTKVYLCTSDKDLCQCVSSNVFILNTHKDNLIWGPEEVQKEFGVLPQQIVDFLAITGDKSDNVPGLTGFGPKAASALLKEWGSIDEILKHPESVGNEKKQKVLQDEREELVLSRLLVEIDLRVPVPHDREFYRKKEEHAELEAFYRDKKFHSLIKERDKEKTKSDQEHYHLVNDAEALDRLMHTLALESEIAFDVETTALDPMRAELVGISFAVKAGEAYYIPFNGALAPTEVLRALQALFSSPKISFYGHNVKYDAQVLENAGIAPIKLSFDTMLASYLLHAEERQHSLEYLVMEFFGKVKTPITDLIGRGKKAISMAEVPLEQIKEYGAKDADYTVQLKTHLEQELSSKPCVKTLFYEVEMPLLPILQQMERRGIFLDTKKLKHLEQDVLQKIEHVEKEIFSLAGEEFNLSSPKQLSHILFEKLKLKPPKKIQTGFSTDADVLETLTLQHPIATLIIEWRMLEKLRSTYILALPLEVNPKTGRIHCTFNQSGTATGRLSCQNPNLQNIPVRSELGLKVREAFIPEKEGWIYLSADYSQIELRLLAHFSEDPALIEAFQSGLDVHAHTAALIFNKALDEVTPEERFKAKAVNFGIIYGQQAFGLSRELKVSQGEAIRLIDTYFARYRRVKEYLEECKERGRVTGKATTLLGRERKIPEILSKNGMIRQAAERLAVNTPLQGSQADLIKLAMIQIDKKMKELRMKGFLILQIHDELIFELPCSEVDLFAPLCKEVMESAILLKVPCLVNIALGKNWKECYL